MKKEKTPKKAFNKKYIIAGDVLQVYEYEIIQGMNTAKNPNMDDGFNMKVAEKCIKICDWEGNVINTIPETVPMYDWYVSEILGGKTKDTKFNELMAKIVREKQENPDVLLRALTEIQAEKANNKAKNTKANNIKKRNKLIRLVNSNPQLNTFLTLTFAENITDIEQANKYFNNFTKRLNRAMKKLDKKFEYVAVIEFQKRGAVHYHLLCNLQVPFILVHGQKKKTPQQMDYEQRFQHDYWEHGFVTVQPLTPNPQKYSESVDNLGAYLVKYMTKAEENERLDGHKNYFTSQGLNKPQEILLCQYHNYLEGSQELRFGDTDYLEKIYQLSTLTPNYTNEYFGEFTGKVKFKEYNLLRLGLKK